jgi:hypothetical protein
LFLVLLYAAPPLSVPVAIASFAVLLYARGYI